MIGSAPVWCPFIHLQVKVGDTLIPNIMLEEEATEWFILVCWMGFILALAVRPRGEQPRKDLPLISADNATLQWSNLILQRQD